MVFKGRPYKRTLEMSSGSWSSETFWALRDCKRMEYLDKRFLDLKCKAEKLEKLD